MQAWNIKQLKEKMLEDLMQCHSDFERSMVKAIAGKEIRESAIEFSKTRKLTPSEIAIASEYGFKV
jgi:hypothetical protein